MHVEQAEVVGLLQSNRPGPRQGVAHIPRVLQHQVVGHSVSSGYAALVAKATPASLLVHLCPRLGPFPPPAGAPTTFRKNFPFPPRNDDGAMVWDTEKAIDAMYGRLPPETGRALAERLRPSFPPAGEYPLRGHPDVPTVLIYATDDEIFEFINTELG